MSESKFTKGEWKITLCDASVSVWSGDDSITMPKSLNYPNEYRNEVIANAHLIAAAPEMYEAMQEFIARVDKGEIRSKKTYIQFKSILKKARGEK